VTALSPALEEAAPLELSPGLGTSLRRFVARAWDEDRTACIGFAILVIWLLIALTAPLWVPYPATGQDVVHRLQAPSLHHLMGTDSLGRDVLSRTLLGSRVSLPVAIIVILVSGTFGSIVGAVAGFTGGIVDEVIMRVCDITLAFPAIVLAMAITASLGTSLTNAMIAIVVVWWPLYARLMRAQVLTVLPRDHVLAARSTGANELRVMVKHVLPLAMGPVLVQATMDFGSIVLLTAGLSFIGLGAVPPSPEWGAMISDGREQFYSWWIATSPGVAILTVVLASNFLGDGLLDLLDPRRRTFRGKAA